MFGAWWRAVQRACGYQPQALFLGSALPAALWLAQRHSGYSRIALVYPVISR